MSIESAREFYQKVSSDESFRTRIMNTPFTQRAEMVVAEGYTFHQEEWDLVTSEISMPTSENEQEMSDEELELVAGGRTNVALYGLPRLSM